jgi:acyl carrier protein
MGFIPEALLRRYLMLVPSAKEIPRELELASLGLDSMSAIALVLELEEMFRITFHDSMLDAKTFHSVTTLESAVRTLLAEKE